MRSDRYRLFMSNNKLQVIHTSLHLFAKPHSAAHLYKAKQTISTIVPETSENLRYKDVKV